MGKTTTKTGLLMVAALLAGCAQANEGGIDSSTSSAEVTETPDGPPATGPLAYRDVEPTGLIAIRGAALCPTELADLATNSGLLRPVEVDMSGPAPVVVIHGGTQRKLDGPHPVYVNEPYGVFIARLAPGLGSAQCSIVRAENHRAPVLDVAHAEEVDELAQLTVFAIARNRADFARAMEGADRVLTARAGGSGVSAFFQITTGKGAAKVHTLTLNEKTTDPYTDHETITWKAWVGP